MYYNLLSRAAEWFFRHAVYLRFGRESAEADIVTDYIDAAQPDYAGAVRAWRTFARLRRDVRRRPAVRHTAQAVMHAQASPGFEAARAVDVLADHAKAAAMPEGAHPGSFGLAGEPVRKELKAPDEAAALNPESDLYKGLVRLERVVGGEGQAFHEIVGKAAQALEAMADGSTIESVKEVARHAVFADLHREIASGALSGPWVPDVVRMVNRVGARHGFAFAAPVLKKAPDVVCGPGFDTAACAPEPLADGGEASGDDDALVIPPFQRLRGVNVRGRRPVRIVVRGEIANTADSRARFADWVARTLVPACEGFELDVKFRDWSPQAVEPDHEAIRTHVLD